MLTISSLYDLFHLFTILTVIYNITFLLKVPFILFDFIARTGFFEGLYFCCIRHSEFWLAYDI
jgi:hypothetical protein